MRQLPRSKRAAFIVAGAASLALMAAGCSDDMMNDASDAMPSATMTDDAMNSSLQQFGAGCAAVPKEGDGSFVGMSSEQVATAASNNPLLSTLVGAVMQADLVDTLNSSEGITVFAPVNDAFAKLDKETLETVLADKELLTSVLTYHVVAGQLPPDQLAGTHETLNGQSLEVTGSGESFTVNGSADVICGDVRTANATVYIIDGVLTPKS